MNNTEKNEILAAIGKLDGKFDFMQEQIICIQKEVAKIPEIQKEVAKIPEIQKEVAKIPEIQKEVAKIPEMQKEISKIPEMQKEISKIPEIQKEVVEIQKEVAEIQKETRKISRSVAVIEHEHGDKLKALFDAFTINTEKIEAQEKRINFCERKLENHDAEMYYLKAKVQGL